MTLTCNHEEIYTNEFLDANMYRKVYFDKPFTAAPHSHGISYLRLLHGLMVHVKLIHEECIINTLI